MDNDIVLMTLKQFGIDPARHVQSLTAIEDIENGKPILVEKQFYNPTKLGEKMLAKEEATVSSLDGYIQLTISKEFLQTLYDTRELMMQVYNLSKK